MKICGVVIVLILMFGIAKIWDRKRFLLILAGAMVCFAAAFINESGTDNEPITSIRKTETGEGAEEKKLVAKVEDEEIDIDVSVPERKYTTEEAESILEKEADSLTERILEDNESTQRIDHDLNLPESGENTSVSIEWYSSDISVLNWNGEIQEDVQTSGQEVTLKAILSLQSEEKIYEVNLKVYPKAVSGDLKEDIQNEIQKSNQDAEEQNYYLPDSVDGKEVRWYEARENTFGYLCVLILIAGIFLNISQKQKEEDKRKQRTERLKRDYSELVSRLIMMLYSGSSMRRAFYRIGNSYQKRKKEDRNYRRNEAFEEVVILCHEIENGITESKAYENLAERCALPCYRTLSVSLIQNQKRGSSQVMESLEQEVINAFGEKKCQARIAGDAASIKLLLPLGLMLMIAFVLMLIPAFLSL